MNAAPPVGLSLTHIRPPWAATMAFEMASRAYVPAYMDGRRLCRAFAARDPGNFTRLLTEQLTNADVLA